MPHIAFRLSLAGLAAVAGTFCAARPNAPPAPIVEQPAARNVPGGCRDPAAGRNDKAGCYLTAVQPLGALPGQPLYWHLHTYPDRASAGSAAGRRSIVVEAFGRIWLYTLAERSWRPKTGARVAVIGPLRIRPSVHYTARYMEATFPPGLKTGVHAHSGPEAWYVISGAQCLQTPDRTIIARAGDSALVPEGPAMMLSSLGDETRRSVLLVLHDSGKPWTMAQGGWLPPGPC
jgi:quercetin dioxygenase-like cupin family protein